MKRKIYLWWLGSPNQGCSQNFHCFWSSYKYLIHYQEQRFSCSLDACIAPHNYVTIEPRMVIKFWACSSNSLNTCLFYLCSWNHTYHSKIGVLMRKVVPNKGCLPHHHSMLLFKDLKPSCFVWNSPLFVVKSKNNNPLFLLRTNLQCKCDPLLLYGVGYLVDVVTMWGTTSSIVMLN